jgi:hypothetical protein
VDGDEGDSAAVVASCMTASFAALAHPPARRTARPRRARRMIRKRVFMVMLLM